MAPWMVALLVNLLLWCSPLLILGVDTSTGCFCCCSCWCSTCVDTFILGVTLNIYASSRNNLGNVETAPPHLITGLRSCALSYHSSSKQPSVMRWCSWWKPTGADWCSARLNWEFTLAPVVNGHYNKWSKLVHEIVCNQLRGIQSFGKK